MAKYIHHSFQEILLQSSSVRTIFSIKYFQIKMVSEVTERLTLVACHMDGMQDVGQFLRQKISANGIKPELSKIEAVLQMAPPSNVS